MENLVGVFRASGRNGLKKYGFAYVKSQVDALDKCKKKLEDGETLTEIWLCKWRDIPSKYTLIYGVETPDNKVPNLDFCANLRTQHIKPKGENGKPYRGIRSGIKETTKDLIKQALTNLRAPAVEVKAKEAKPHIKLALPAPSVVGTTIAQQNAGSEYILIVATGIKGA